MNREDKSIPKVMHEITFWMTFLYREASRCTSADCRLFFNSLTSPFLFDSLKNVVELVDMLNRILNCWNIVHLTWQAFKISLSQSSASYFNDVKIISSLNLPFLTLQNDQKNIPFWSRWSALIVKRAPLIFPARDTQCCPTWMIRYTGTVSNLPRSNKQAWLIRKETEKDGSLQQCLIFL